MPPAASTQEPSTKCKTKKRKSFGETLLELISYILTPANCSASQNHFTPPHCSLSQPGAVTQTIPEKLAGAPGKVQFSPLRARRPGKSWLRERGRVLESVAVPTVSKYPEITLKLLSFFPKLEVFFTFLQTMCCSLTQRRCCVK